MLTLYRYVHHDIVGDPYPSFPLELKLYACTSEQLGYLTALFNQRFYPGIYMDASYLPHHKWLYLFHVYFGDGVFSRQGILWGME